MSPPRLYWGVVAGLRDIPWNAHAMGMKINLGCRFLEDGYLHFGGKMSVIK